MNRLLVTASGVITLAAGAVYVRSAIREAEPQIVSWLVWTALLVIGACSSLAGGQVPAAVYVLACAAMCAAVVLLVIRRGTWKPGPLGWACLAGAVAGLVLLIFTRAPSLTIAVTVAVDFTAYVPTMAHAWRAPGEEPWAAYALFAAGAALALAAADRHVFTAVAYPLYLLIADTAVAVMIAGRRAAGPGGKSMEGSDVRVQERRQRGDATAPGLGTKRLGHGLGGR